MAAAMALAEKVTVRSEPIGDTPLPEKKRKLAEDDVKPDLAYGSASGARSPPGFSTQKPPKSGLDNDRKPLHVLGRHDGDIAGWEAARQLLEGIGTPSQERTFASLPQATARRGRAAAAAGEHQGRARRGSQKALTTETRNSREAAVREYLGSTEHRRRLADHALAGYERGLEDTKCVALRRYPHLDPAQLVVPPDADGSP
ncbi:hypothetical protein EJB05_45976, partial [Eragrostis curvula]